MRFQYKEAIIFDFHHDPFNEDKTKYYPDTEKNQGEYVVVGTEEGVLQAIGTFTWPYCTSVFWDTQKGKTLSSRIDELGRDNVQVRREMSALESPWQNRKGVHNGMLRIAYNANQELGLGYDIPIRSACVIGGGYLRKLENGRINVNGQSLQLGAVPNSIVQRVFSGPRFEIDEVKSPTFRKNEDSRNYMRRFGYRWDFVFEVFYRGN